MSRDDLERMAEGIVRLRSEILRRRAGEPDLPGAELTTPQALALRTIVLDGPLRMGALAETLGVSVATASRTVDALAARGLLRRESDPADARAVLVCATRRGKREWAARRERFVAALEQLMDELSEHERRQLSESLEALNRLFGRRDATGARKQTG
jgi:DNA-binding MarR family transcriptional regulator